MSPSSMTCVLALIGMCAVACEEPRTASKQAQIDTMQKEQRPEKLLAQGRAYYAIGDISRAEQYFATAIDAGGNAHEILPLLLKACIHGGRFRVAIEYVDAQRKKEPRDPELAFLEGTLLMSVDKAEAAKLAFEKTLELAPKHAEAHYWLGVVLRDQMHDLVQADPHFRQYLALSPQGEHRAEAQSSLLQDVQSAKHLEEVHP